MQDKHSIWLVFVFLCKFVDDPMVSRTVSDR
jgi:hypothetical protein